MQTQGLNPAHTWKFDASLVGLSSGAPVDQTLHRALRSLPGAAPSLPTLPVGEGLALQEVELLGEGGMGRVHRAIDPVLLRAIALKRPRPEAGPRAAQALVEEARILAALDHPRIVPVHALGEHPEGGPALVMKQVQGRPWSELLALGRELRRDLGILRAVGEALAFAHARGWLHRDLKPENVLVGDFGEVYLVDWGCACRLEGARTVEVVGTPACMAPEMVQPGAPLSEATDVYLLGATLQHLLTGERLHGRGPLAEVLQRAWTAEPPEPGPAASAELAAILRRACAREPAERFPTVRAFLEALDAVDAHSAAMELVAEARDLLSPLEEAVRLGSPEADRVFVELRLALRAAARLWPDCPELGPSLDRALAAWVPAKLAQGELVGVEAVLIDLPPERAARWTPGLEAAREARERLYRDAREQDLRVAAGERRRMAAVALGMGVVMGLGVTLGQPAEGYSPESLPALGMIPLLVVAGMAARLWRRIRESRPSRAMILGFIVLLVSSQVNRVIGLLDGRTVAQIISIDLLLFVLSFATLALATDARLGLALIPLSAGLAAVLALPVAALRVYPAAMILSLMVCLFVFNRQMSSPAARSA